MEFRSVGEDEAAVIFREGGVELVVPELDDPRYNEEGSVPSHLQEACAVAMLLRHPDQRFVELRAQLQTLFETVATEEPEGESPN